MFYAINQWYLKLQRPLLCHDSCSPLQLRSLLTRASAGCVLGGGGPALPDEGRAQTVATARTEKAVGSLK